jgi:hypothetical protein
MARSRHQSARRTAPPPAPRSQHEHMREQGRRHQNAARPPPSTPHDHTSHAVTKHGFVSIRVQNPALGAGTVLDNMTPAPCARGLPHVSVLTFSGRCTSPFVHCSRDSSRAGQDFGPESGGVGLDAQAKFVRSSAADQRSPPPRTCRLARPRHTYPPPRSRRKFDPGATRRR